MPSAAADIDCEAIAKYVAVAISRAIAGGSVSPAAGRAAMDAIFAHLADYLCVLSGAQRDFLKGVQVAAQGVVEVPISPDLKPN